MNTNLAVLPSTGQYREALISMFHKMYDEDGDGCGICEKEGSEVGWSNHISESAHEKCFRIIKPTEDTLFKEIEKLYEANIFAVSRQSRKNSAHAEAVEAVRLACDSDLL